MKHLSSAFFVVTICNAQIIATVAGGGGEGPGDNGPATKAQMMQPVSVALDGAGNLYIADSQDQRVRKVDATGVITTLAGTGNRDFSGDGGPAATAGLNTPSGVAVDTAGNVYIADRLNHRIRRVTAAGIITTFAGTGTASFSGDGGPATSATLNSPDAVAVDGAGNVYISDTNNRRIRKVTVAGTISTFAGNGTVNYSGDGGPAISAGIPAPGGVFADAAGNLYVSDSTNRIRKVNTSGVISTVAGVGGTGAAGDGGPALSAQLSTPTGVALDGAGNLYIGDTFNNRVRKVTPAGTITTFAGGGLVGGNFGDGGPATSASLALPNGVAVDGAGNVFIADSNHGRVRKVLSAAGPVLTLVANAFGDAPTIAPNTWVELKGTALSSTSRIWQGADFVNNLMPTQLDAVSVTVNGRRAFVYYISSTQVNILTPPDDLSGTVQVQLTNAAGSSAMNVAAQTASPSFFVFDGVHVTATHLNGNLIGPETLYPGASTPAAPNETIILYANGLGATSSPVVGGAITQGGTLSQFPILNIGGIPATVSFAGLISPGLFQLNVLVPPLVPDGDNALTGTYNGQAMQTGVILNVRR
ncbi:MAG: hypothetical protein LAO79_00675 [Acidobacteriia bacterium]|nr:hypothetical protein [Terriglobia bacterium]